MKMEDKSRKKFNYFLFYVLLFVSCGIDMTLHIYYSFFVLTEFLGHIFLLKKIKYDELTKGEYFLMLFIIPVILGILFSFLR